MSGLRADPAESDALGRLVTENAWLGQSVLTAFADDPATPAELAETARRWQYDVAFGLWQIADQVPSPGVWCTDIVTGERRYAAIPSHHLSDVHRWGVLLCALVADHGVWRPTGAVLALRPAEADMLAESVNDGLVDLLHDKGILYPGGKGAGVAAFRCRRRWPRADQPGGCTGFQRHDGRRPAGNGEGPAHIAQQPVDQ